MLLYEEKKAKRIEKEKPILDSFWAWLEGVSPLPGSKLEKAVNTTSPIQGKDSRIILRMGGVP